MFDLIAANKRNSILLAIVMTVLLLIAGWALGMNISNDPVSGLFIAAIVSIMFVAISYFGGSGIILGLSHARKIAHDDNPQLFNVVEEMAIAAGLPMPEVYLIDDGAPNAFATGRDPQHAVVAVTTGLLEKLDRDELQGVIAHEMSHVRNYDIRFAMLMAVMVGVIALLCDFAWRISFRRAAWGGGGRRRDGRGGGGAMAILMVVALVLAIIAPFVAKIIQLAISRQREYLADASAAELTRFPEGLARALEKIAADPQPLEVASGATQHLYIINPFKALGAHGWFSTHPPTSDRIARLRSIAAKAQPV